MDEFGEEFLRETEPSNIFSNDFENAPNRRFPFVKEGVDKLARAECAGLFVEALGFVLGFLENNLFFFFVGGLLALALAIVSLILTIQGLNRASLERTEFGTLLTIYVLSLVFSIVGNAFGDSFIATLIKLLATILSISYILKLFDEIAVVLRLCGQNEVADRTYAFRKKVIIFYIGSFLGAIIAGVIIVLAVSWKGVDADTASIIASIPLVLLAIFGLYVAIKTYSTLSKAAEAM